MKRPRPRYHGLELVQRKDRHPGYLPNGMNTIIRKEIAAYQRTTALTSLQMLRSPDRRMLRVKY
jgi:hypothetical protein